MKDLPPSMPSAYLDTANIDRSAGGVEYHPLKPFIPAGCRVLFLGSFPPPRKRWCMDFFYPNFINDHWRIEGLVFFADKDRFVDVTHRKFLLNDIIAFAASRGIGFYDTATAVRRLKDNASDKFLEVVEPTDITRLLQQAPGCGTIVTTGEKATATVCGHFGINALPKAGSYVTFGIDDAGREIHLYRLPSSSRAYPLPLDMKAAEYARMFRFARILK